ncbi:orotate phosphoribosyltransferase [Pterulicium gracile]|uniref:orotate phosphoribosyltransferase n=1 Tax=Pterulicium gracile TaxID=1884261 RepID=A0A5C3QVP9_9AGAR|nr:orotate phosphoribosyltransferase [Pterula gracilis]
MSFAPSESTSTLIEAALDAGALKFGTFTLKSGRQSPYFFNASFLSSGALLNAVANAYASVIMEMFNIPPSSLSGAADPPANLPFDVLFGPAYKGIPFAACTALVLSTCHSLPISVAYDRKEAKTHGEGGSLVGPPLKGKRVVILDDVMTAGTAVRGVLRVLREEGAEVVGVVQLLDREELGGGVELQGGEVSAVKDVEKEVGIGKVKCVLRARDLLGWLQENGTAEEVRRMKEYREMYGVKDM